MGFLKQKKRRTKILLQTRSNLWGGVKLLSLNKLKWKRIRRNLRKIKPQYLRFYKKRLKPQQQFTRRVYKRVLIKKQNFRSYYGNIRESQLKKLFLKMKHKANSNETQLDLVIRELESRLDVIIFRMGFVNTFQDAHNLITHGKILVNGKVVKSANLILNKNDLITIHPNAKKMVFNKIGERLFISYVFYLLTLFPKKYKSNFRFKEYKRIVSYTPTKTKLMKKIAKHFKFSSTFNQKNDSFYRRKRLIKVLTLKNKRKKRKYRKKKRKYNILLKNDLFLYKFKNKLILNFLNQPKDNFLFKESQFNLYKLIRTPINVLVNYQTLMGIFLYGFDLKNVPYHSFMDLKLVQKFYYKN